MRGDACKKLQATDSKMLVPARVARYSLSTDSGLVPFSKKVKTGFAKELFPEARPAKEKFSYNDITNDSANLISDLSFVFPWQSPAGCLPAFPIRPFSILATFILFLDLRAALLFFRFMTY